MKAKGDGGGTEGTDGGGQRGQLLHMHCQLPPTRALVCLTHLAYQLITVVIAAAGGGLLLILGIALIVTCCR